jgi:basic membrane lipoprotein Med (substrate-binding protein (PBP1-ABC) superfamily)
MTHPRSLIVRLLLLALLLALFTHVVAAQEATPAVDPNDPCGPAGTAAAAEMLTALSATGDLSAYTAKIGFIFVGPVDDYGYNYAANQGRLCLEALLPNVETIYAENVPENAEAERVMEQMIRAGATIIFPTSYGHYDPAVNVSQKYPDVKFMHMGGLQPTDQVGSFFGEIWQMEYAAGVAAGMMTESNKLGFVAAFPIPQVLLNMNAFELGAKSVNPDATTTVVFSGNWCDPATLAEAANSLIDQGIDVLTQHQDCPKPILEVADRRGIWSVGYHADASTVAGEHWITGGRWVWGPLMTKLVIEALDGTYTPELLRVGVADGAVALSAFGPDVPDDVKAATEQAVADIISGDVYPFEGPIMKQDGTVAIAEGERPDTPTLETTNYLVEGVIGTIPQ